MELRPRLSAAEARLLAVELRPDQPTTEYPLWIGQPAIAIFCETCAKQPETWLGVWAWPDGMVAMIPVPREGQKVQDVLGLMYELVRSETERQVLAQFPSAGEA